MQEYPLWDHQEFLADGLNMKDEKDWKKFMREVLNYIMPAKFLRKRSKERRAMLHSLERKIDPNSLDPFIHRKAITITNCATAGIIEIEGKRLDAKSIAGYIEANTEVRIVGQDMKLLTIRPLHG